MPNMDAGSDQPDPSNDCTGYVRWEYDRLCSKILVPTRLGGFFYKPQPLGSRMLETSRGCLSSPFVMWLTWGGDVDTTLWRRRSLKYDAETSRKLLLQRGRKLHQMVTMFHSTGSFPASLSAVDDIIIVMFQAQRITSYYKRAVEVLDAALEGSPVPRNLSVAERLVAYVGDGASTYRVAVFKWAGQHCANHIPAVNNVFRAWLDTHQLWARMPPGVEDPVAQPSNTNPNANAHTSRVYRELGVAIVRSAAQHKLDSLGLALLPPERRKRMRATRTWNEKLHRERNDAYFHRHAHHADDVPAWASSRFR